MRVVLLLCVAAGLGACDEGTSRVRGVACVSNFECTLGETFGTCQENGYCAYPDATCANGARYTPGAPDVGGLCVGGACGGAGEACCASDACNDGLGCNSEATCTCGDEEGQPCCGGTTCGTNLACSDGTCACGGPGEPCCGGNTCDSGATCAAGTCPTTWTKIAVGRHFACGVRLDGRVACWGSDRFQYGRENPGQLNAVVDSLTPIVIANAVNVDAIDAGEGHACVRKTDKTLWCWGQGTRGQLGNGQFSSSSVAVQVSGLSNVSAFSVGRQHTCAVGTVGSVAGLYCWGKNGNRNRIDAQMVDIWGGRLGNGGFANSATPVAVDMSQMAASGQTPTLVAAGGYHTCAAMSDQRVWCWGANESNAIGDNTDVDRFVPTLVDFSQITIPNGVTIAELEIGTGYMTRNGSFMRLSDGTVYNWGGDDPQAGFGTGATPDRPTTPVAGGHVFTKLAPIVRGMCALDNGGKVWCWGQGTTGQLGNGDTSDELLPVEATLPMPATALSAGHRTACVLAANSKLYCWGNNRKGVITRTLPTTANELIQTAQEVP